MSQKPGKPLARWVCQQLLRVSVVLDMTLDVEDQTASHLAGEPDLVCDDDHGHAFVCQLLHDLRHLVAKEEYRGNTADKATPRLLVRNLLGEEQEPEALQPRGKAHSRVSEHYALWRATRVYEDDIGLPILSANSLTIDKTGATPEAPVTRPWYVDHRSGDSAQCVGRTSPTKSLVLSAGGLLAVSRGVAVAHMWPVEKLRRAFGVMLVAMAIMVTLKALF